MSNVFLFEKINGLANVYTGLNYLAIFFADYLLYIVLALIFIGLFIKRSRLMAVSTAVAVFIARIIFAEPLKQIFHQARPYVVLENVNKLINEHGDYASFPSGHAVIFFAVATAVFLFNRKLGIFAFFIALLVGIARVYAGVHWPIDIVAGGVIGILAGIITNNFIIVPIIKRL